MIATVERGTTILAICGMIAAGFNSWLDSKEAEVKAAGEMRCVEAFMEHVSEDH